MLKKTLLMLVVVAGLAAAVVLPAASAHTVVPAVAKAPSSCPPGDSGSSNYCDFHCVVPALEGDSIRSAISALHAADCRLGRIRLAILEPKGTPALSPKTYSVFKVVRQFPLAGATLAFDARVAIWVKFNRPL